ncbi:MAG TPA: LacI family DNA-binding transcriptional regulator [Gemmatimonadales bacterium]|jgi:LacI family transcriptional regulator|nr:LacI family DNA-binding transcriptional regulator [Gemmatimonadales bacterium]
MVTIRDVARTAGVSIATASRAINDSPLVAGETRARVQDVAARLCYSPHGAARSLSTSRTHTIGILLPDLYGEFFSELIRGIDQTAQGEGFHCLLASARHTGPLLEGALRSMRGRVDGLILMSPEFTGELSRRTLPEGFPVILVHCPPTEQHKDGVLVANDQGARAMVRHLAGLGHRRIAIIRGAEGNYDATERLRGYREALAECGLVAEPALEAPGDFSEESGAGAVRELLALPPPEQPTAIFAANDCMAIGALSALREAGLRVPEDMGLGGFDDIPMARYMTPPLTSVHVDISALGARAAARLLDLLQGRAGPAPYRETFPTTLVVRQSCGANLLTTPRRVAV